MRSKPQRWGYEGLGNRIPVAQASAHRHGRVHAFVAPWPVAESSHRAKRLTELEASRPAGLWGISELLSAGYEDHDGTTRGRATR